MSNIFINEKKYGFTIKLKNKSTLKFKVQNCKCISSINQNDNMWFIKIQVPDNVDNKIIQIEKEVNNIVTKYELLSSLDNDSYINLKIPYRYNKFECDFFNNNDQRILSNDICPDDILTIDFQCINIWKNDKYCSLTWKTKFIKKM